MHINQAESAVKQMTLYNQMGFAPQDIYISNIVEGAAEFRPEMNEPVKGPMYNSLLNSTNLSATGFDAAMTTLTQIRQDVVSQVFYEVPFADFVPVKVGFGAWSDQILTYKSYLTGDDFESGIVNSAIRSRLAETNVAIEPTYLKNQSWAKETGYSLIQIQEAAKSGNWSLIEQLEKSRKTNWDLGLQKIAFLGHTSDTGVKGLLNQSGVETDSTTLADYIYTLDAADFQTFVSVLIGLYFENTNSTRLPDTFIIPMKDYLGLTSATSAEFPISSKITYLLEAFKAATGNPNFTIKGIAYCDLSNNNLGVNRYCLYRNSSDTLQMFIPVNYTSTVIGTLNNFQFQSVAYGQFTGVQALRPLELYYLDWS